MPPFPLLPSALAAVLLEWDASTDQLHAVGTQGGEMFKAFFDKYAFKLDTEYGARAKSAGIAIVLRKPLTRDAIAKAIAECLHL